MQDCFVSEKTATATGIGRRHGTSDVQVSAVRDLVVLVVRDGQARVLPARARRGRAHARALQQRRAPRAHRHAAPERRDPRRDCATNHLIIYLFLSVQINTIGVSVCNIIKKNAF